MAAVAIRSAAAMYFSIRIGGSESTSPMLSKPYPESSAGKSAAGFRSTPSRSRMVLLYSARFRRRAVTRPGSGRLGPAASAASPPRLRIHASTASTALGSGRVWPGGGISPRTSFSRTCFQRAGSPGSGPDSGKESNSSPAVFIWRLWQPTQFWFKKGRTESRNAWSSPALARVRRVQRRDSLEDQHQRQKKGKQRATHEREDFSFIHQELRPWDPENSEFALTKADAIDSGRQVPDTEKPASEPQGPKRDGTSFIRRGLLPGDPLHEGHQQELGR